MHDELLTVPEASDRLGMKSQRFVRRLIAERRITFVHVGRHVRIPASAIEKLIKDGTVEPMDVQWSHGRVVA